MNGRVRKLPPITLGQNDAEDASLVFELPGRPADDPRYLRNVTIPTLTPYLPDPQARTGTSIIVAPGGGLHFLSIENEGSWVAQRLAEEGIAAFVLQYRVAPTPVAEVDLQQALKRMSGDAQYLADLSRQQRTSSLADANAALRLVRENAHAWGIEPDRLGMLGFSAGGYVSVLAALDCPPPERPSFIAPIYPAWWDEITVPDPAIPMFLAWATDDQGGDLIVGSALRLYEAWWRAGAPVEAHAYTRGGHGFGMRPQQAPSDDWFTDFLRWLPAAGF